MPGEQRVGISATASYLPPDWVSAAQLEDWSGIPEEVFIKRFGLDGKHVARDGEHVSNMAAEAGRRLLEESGTDPASIDAVVYFGSTWKDYQVWQAAPKIVDELGCTRAFALELDYVSCGSVVALRVAKALAASDKELDRILLVGASRESHLIDYLDAGSRFAFNFGDGAVAALVERRAEASSLLATSMKTDGSLSHHVKVPAGGSVLPASHETVDKGQHMLRVEDTAAMKLRLDQVSLGNFLEVCHDSARRSAVCLDEIDWVLPIHLKQSMHSALLAALGVGEDRAVYLRDTGHMSGVDNILALDRLSRSGRLAQGDLVLMVAAGTGYTWGATLVRWGRSG